MRLYHGSPMKVEQPELELCRPHNDYGRGLYCTQDKELAMEWACNRPGQNGFCNAYELDLEGLAVLNLDDASYGVLAWLAVLMEHRIFDSEWNAASTKDRFIERYRVDLSDADVVCGYRADDSYFSIARAFLSGAITDTQAAEALHLGNLGRQTMLRSPPRAFASIRFAGAEIADASVWYTRRSVRDASARRKFQAMRAAENTAQGSRIYELLED